MSGGITLIGFKSCNQYINDPDCCVFNLKTRFKKFIKSPYAVEDFDYWGPRFDWGSLGLAGDFFKINETVCCTK